MSAPCTVISFWPSSCQKLWKLVEIWQSYAKTILTVFRHGVWHLRRSDSTAAVGRPTERGSTARHWSSSTWPHHSSAQTASLAACEDQRLDFRLSVLVHKSLHGLAPPYLSDDCQLVTEVGRGHLRSSDVNTCTVPRTQSQIGDRSFTAAGPRLWMVQPADWDPTERHYFWTF